MNVQEQLAFLEAFKGYYREQPFAAQRTEHRRYYFDNPYYSYADAISLYSMIRHARPRGSWRSVPGTPRLPSWYKRGFFGNSIACTFIDPYPDRLDVLLRKSDRALVEIIFRRVQGVPLDRF
jgi:hypothetical protein